METSIEGGAEEIARDAAAWHIIQYVCGMLRHPRAPAPNLHSRDAMKAAHELSRFGDEGRVLHSQPELIIGNGGGKRPRKTRRDHHGDAAGGNGAVRSGEGESERVVEGGSGWGGLQWMSSGWSG